MRMIGRYLLVATLAPVLLSGKVEDLMFYAKKAQQPIALRPGRIRLGGKVVHRVHVIRCGVDGDQHEEDRLFAEATSKGIILLNASWRGVSYLIDITGYKKVKAYVAKQGDFVNAERVSEWVPDSVETLWELIDNSSSGELQSVRRKNNRRYLIVSAYAYRRLSIQ